ncbi:hypothetical protein E4U55_005004 [Claviceps digitariae]|nr:hypothetical protein E4U55_005004 [Claviceps digitariae]
MGYERLFMGLRAAELVLAVIALGLAGDWIARSDWAIKRFIYTITVSGIASMVALVWLLPFSANFVHWPVDTIISVMWWVAFGLIVNVLPARCGIIFNWQCGKFKAVVAFSFLSALLWLASASIGIFSVRRREDRAAGAKGSGGGWFRRSQV